MMKTLGILFLFVAAFLSGNAQDSLKRYTGFTYFRVGIDVSKPILSALDPNLNSLEIQWDANYKKGLNLVVESGFGHSKTQNDFLQFKSQNYFVRLGIDKYFFGKEFGGDLDNAFAGLRYGVSYVGRGKADYIVTDPLWGQITGEIPATSYLLHWLELTGGFRLEVFKNIFLGWNIRGKTIMNPKKVKELAPYYISGYGKGDKIPVFDYNFYVCFGLGKRD